MSSIRLGSGAFAFVLLLVAAPAFAQEVDTDSAQTAQDQQAAPNRQTAQNQQPAATAPSGGSQAPSLGDLGFPTAETQGSAAEQARLDKRSHMLRIHQRLGLITTVPFIATLVAAGGAGGRNSSSSGRDLHAALGITTAGLYFTTASFAILAPRIHGTPTRGPSKLHKALAFIHGPGMILTPILGAMALHQRSSGQRVHGIASAHGAVAAITGVAYGAALLSVSVKF